MTPVTYVPVQQAAKSGSSASGPGPTVDLSDPGGAVNLQYGSIQPVSQLGSQQLASGRLARNKDGSVTLWLAPKLPAGAPETNWIPTPSAAYYEGSTRAQQPMATNIRPLMRMYYPTPGDTPPSILPPPDGPLTATYVFPELKKVG